MRKSLAILSALLFGAVLLPMAAQAQEAQMPEKCQGAAGMNMAAMGQMMDMPMGKMMEHMHVLKLQDFHKDYMAGMRKTMPPMMQGMMMEDADAAFICGMIAHHMGAIEMSKTVLQYGDSEEAKTLAKKIIDAQTKEIDEMSKWVDANVK